MSNPKKNLGAINADAALEDLAKSFPSATAKSQGPRPVRSRKREPEHPMTVRIPQYVAKAMRLAHAETGKSHRIMVLEALNKWGIPINAEDLVERRRGPSSQS